MSLGEFGSAAQQKRNRRRAPPSYLTGGHTNSYAHTLCLFLISLEITRCGMKRLSCPVLAQNFNFSELRGRILQFVVEVS